MADSKLQTILNDQQLAANRARDLLDAFGAPFEEAGAILADYKTIAVKDETDTATMQLARKKRLALKKTRVDVEHTRKALKADIIKEGRAIDSVAKFVKEMVEPAEQYLEEQEKFAERKAEERRLKVVAERRARLAELTDTPEVYAFEAMTDSDFDRLTIELKQAIEARIMAEKEAAAERARLAKEAEAERERMRLENERLKAEAAVAEEAARKEREAAEAKLAAERAKAEEERRKREAVEAEQRRQAEEAARKEREAAEAKRQALLAPDRDKLIAFADVIDHLDLPNVANREAGKVLDETKDFLIRISKNLRQKAAQL